MNSFEVKELSLPGVFRINTKLHTDTRGFSAPVYHNELYKALGIESAFATEFTSRSQKGVVRGFHYQRAPHMQDKLVRCSYGEIFDVAADCDPGSPTYGASVGLHLNGDEQGMLFIPGRYANGFAVLSDIAIVEYKVSNEYHPELVSGARFDDPLLNIKWPLVGEPILSALDKAWPPLSR